MSTEATSTSAGTTPTPVDHPLTTQDLAAVLVRHYGLREGKFDLMIEYQIGAGAVGPDKDHVLPGLMIGVAKIGLVPASKDSPLTVDAAAVNPPLKSRRKP